MFISKSQDPTAMVSVAVALSSLNPLLIFTVYDPVSSAAVPVILKVPETISHKDKYLLRYKQQKTAIFHCIF